MADSQLHELINEKIPDNTVRAVSPADLRAVLIALANACFFTSDINVNLAGVKSLGKYLSGQTITAIGKTAIEVINDIGIEYISAVFSSFSVAGQAQTVEVGTTISGSKTFTWAIVSNSSIITTIGIFDVTADVGLLPETLNDGTQSIVVTTNKLNANGSVQAYRGVAHDANNGANINSALFSITAKYLRFFGPTVISPADSTAVRALPSAFHSAGSFILPTGNSLTKFAVALPPGSAITSAIDQSALNADITSQYVLTGTKNVTDAGGTNRVYNIFEMNISVPYDTSHNHLITTT